MDFGNKLKRLRVQAEMTQQQLASQMNVSKSVVSFYERQERMPSPDVLIKLSRIFHVSSDYLLGIDETERLDVSGLDEEDILILTQLVDIFRRKNKK